jgi:hypothetical protein
MENEPRYEESRILNTAKLIGEGAVMVSGDSGPRLEVTADQFSDINTEMEADLGARGESRSKERMEESIDSQMDLLYTFRNVAKVIDALTKQHRTPEEISQHFEDQANQLSTHIDATIARYGLNKR